MTISDKEQWAKNDVFQLGRTKIAANKQRLESKWIGGYPTCRSCQFLFHGACDFSICRSIHVRSAARHLGRFFWKNISNAHRRIDYCWWFRNPVNSPVEVGSLSTIIYKVYISEVVQDSFINSMFCPIQLRDSMCQLGLDWLECLSGWDWLIPVEVHKKWWINRNPSILD